MISEDVEQGNGMCYAINGVLHFESGSSDIKKWAS